MSSTETRRTIALVGPYPPYRGGIAQFTERLSGRLERAGFDVEKISFRRQYPGVLFPGKSQFEVTNHSDHSDHPDRVEHTDPGEDREGAGYSSYSDHARHGARSGEAAGDIRAVLDSMNPFSWQRTYRQILESGVRMVVFMYWMPFFAPAYAFISFRLRRRGIRVMSLVHNVYPHERHTGDGWLSKLFLKRCNTVIVLSKKVGEDVGALAPAVRVRFAPHPAYDQFGPAQDTRKARKSLGLPESGRIILFFGLVRRYKGLENLIDAVAEVRQRLSDVHLVVAGEFYEDVSETLHRIDSLGLGSSVTVDNRYIPTDDVARYFSAADVVVQPYLTATQSGVLPVAFHFGRPVIVTDTGGLAELVESSGAGLVTPPGDSHSLALAILDYFQNDGNERFAEGVRMARNRSSWDRFVELLVDEHDTIQRECE